ncbi:FxSxx-COOH system tetratricopeptide repeat protein [Micromonospora sp. WMMD714]|uniref:FxSxx-COOH system tetratricopeptide repeat protein n=1 Tax=Micromonospora sp. WMMD714 TaxID=3016097 RepID=UPI00249B9F38|nr:FxSxx-COOH system tetratricopeptide repeat protein [Micromonospora sp. WMMD714]WFE65712.1 FxSxx-COOH system tetratricopeptide repeat protein [Micromonospora sp. WMMD714]
MTPPRDGQVVTFYSYKGGTGRTMALANTAWILAANGHRVLVADWDLESPGLHRFFAPFLDPEQVASTGGVMDLILEYEWENVRRRTEGGDTRPGDWHRQYARVHKYAFSVTWEFPGGGTLDLLLAGRHNPDYATSVTGLNWDNFYNRLGGAQFFDALRADMKRHYDFTLIDSRTGISDVAEICTIHLPDVLVDCFTLSDQGIDGAATVAARVRGYEGRRARRVLPVPMRVDEGEKIKTDAGRALAMQRFVGLPSGMTELERQDYWLSVEVPYRAYYAYEETLATFGDVPGSRGLLSAYEALARHITGGAVTGLPRMDDGLRRQTVQRFERKPVIVDELIVLRYAPEDQAWAEWTQSALHAVDLRVLATPLGVPATPPAGAASRELHLVSRSYLAARRAAGGAVRQAGSPVLALHLDDTTPSVETPPGSWATVYERGATAAAEQVWELVGRPSDGRDRPVPATRYPGVEPLVFYAPARNVRFTGRDRLLLALREELKTAARERVPVALRGGAGIGKTQLAMEYAYRFHGAYDVVWWIDADPAQFIDIRFADLGRRLGLPDLQNVPDNIRAVRDWLGHGGRRSADEPPRRWLVVFDNVDQYEHVRDFLPHGEGHVLVTTRNPDWGDLARAVDVEAFQRGESVTHLIGRTGRRGMTVAEAQQVAEAVEDVPILVALAGAWLAESPDSVATYLAGLARTGPDSDVWGRSLDGLREQSPGAYRLLQLGSVLAPDIALDLLYGDQVAKVIAPHDPLVAAQVTDRVSERDIAAALVQRINRLALIKVDLHAQRVQIHRLLQAAMRSRMPEPELREVKHDVHRILAGSRPSGEVDDPAFQVGYRHLWPHLDGSEAVSCHDDTVRQLVIDRVRYIFLNGGFEQGAQYADQVDKTWTTMLEGLSPETAAHRTLRIQLLSLRFNRANLLRSLGRFAEALRLDQETLGQQEELIGANHPYTLMTAGGYAADLRALGRYEDALERDVRSHSACVEVFGEDHHRTLNAVNNLAASHRLMGQFGRARDSDEATYRRLRVVLGPEHPRTLLSANNYARDLREIGDYQGSVALLGEVVEGYRRIFGEHGRPVLTAQANLAASLRSTGRIAEAGRLLDEATERLRSSLGPTNPETLLAALSRAANMMLEGQDEQARHDLIEIEQLFAQVFGPRHPYSLVCGINRGVALWDTADRDEAFTVTVAAADGLREVLGAAHPFSMGADNNVAVFTIMRGQHEEGLVKLRAVVDRLTAALGPDHPDTLRSLGNVETAHQATSGGVVSIGRVRLADRLADLIGQEHPSVVVLRDGRYVRRVLDPHPY